jgi:hypothetical protein
MNQDFVELLRAFVDLDVEFIVVGAHALAAHGHVRATKDLDVWIRPTPENAARAYRALGVFGAPLTDLEVADLATPGTVFQIGVAPVRIDILTQIDAVSFEEAWSERVVTAVGGVRAAVLSRAHLITNKKAAGRLQDLADVERLESGSDE